MSRERKDRQDLITRRRGLSIELGEQHEEEPVCQDRFAGLRIVGTLVRWPDSHLKMAGDQIRQEVQTILWRALKAVLRMIGSH